MVAVRQIPIATCCDRFVTEKSAWVVDKGVMSNRLQWDDLVHDLVFACNETILNFYQLKPRNLWWTTGDIRILKGMLPEVSGNLGMLQIVTSSRNSSRVVDESPGIFKQQTAILKVPSHEAEKLDDVELAAICARILGVRSIFYLGRPRDEILGAKKGTRAWVGQAEQRVVTTAYDLTEIELCPQP